MRKIKPPESATTTMTSQGPLSPQRAFVVQFRAGMEAEVKHFTGRAEHMVSGQTTHFQSVEDLVAFLTRVLAEVQD